jgi:probable rRNA maturation factor
LKIHIYNKQKCLPISRPRFREAVLTVLDSLNLSPDELSLYFVSTQAITDLHAEFFQDPTPTDCITFPIDNSYLGEIFVCPETALLYAQKHSVDPQEELLLYVVHGLLHLAGYDDLDPKSKRIMRKKEKSCMRLLKP